jgi:predicted XRE-type DNA-binding protein
VGGNMSFFDNLTHKQRLVYDMYFNKKTKQKTIASRLQITQPAVAKHIRSIRKKLTKDQNITIPNNKGGAVTKYNLLKINNKWRYHALQFEVRPYYFTKKYYSILKSKGGHSTKLGVWKFVCYYKKVIIWLEAGKDFIHQDRNAAIMWANEDFNKALHKIAQQTGFRIFKEGRAGIKLLKHELAYQNAPEHDYVTQKDVYIKLHDSEGKVFLVYDRSKGIKEREYVGKKTIDNADILELYLRDFIENKPLNNSQLSSRLHDTTAALEKTAQALKTIENILKEKWN